MFLLTSRLYSAPASYQVVYAKNTDKHQGPHRRNCGYEHAIVDHIIR